MDFYNALEERLQSAKESMSELSLVDQNPRILHLERLLRNVVANLQAMLADIEAGCSWSEMGFFGDADLTDALESFDVEINSLKSLIQTAKMLGR